MGALYRENRAFLAPWEPIRDEAFYTDEGQRQRLAVAADELRQGVSYRCAIEDDGRIVGTVALTAIERGPVQSANLGYWVDQSANGRGIASNAVRLMLATAFDELQLHRIQAGTLLHNLASQRVLDHNGFERIGVARSYLNIAGQWQDHVLFQRLPE